MPMFFRLPFKAQELAAEPITADEFRQLAAEVLALAAGHSSQAT